MSLRVEPPELHHLLRTRERQWPQHDAIHDAEDRGGRADPECERQRRNEREAGILAKLPEGEAQILGNGRESFTRVGPMHVGHLH